MATQIFFDGGLRPCPNGGFVACYGWVMKHDNATLTDGKGLDKIERNVGSCMVEYNALIRAMEHAIATGVHKDDEVIIRGDSQVVIGMASGKASAKTDETTRLQSRVRELASQFNRLRFEWIPRELNQEADHLGRVAYAESDETKRRIDLINKVYIQSRRAFGELYDPQIAEAWHLMLTGKRRFAQMSETELNRLMAGISEIPAMIDSLKREAAEVAA